MSVQPTRAARAPWIDLGAVALGGAAGTLLRYLVGSAIPHVAGAPIATWVINITGALLLGALVEVLTGLGAERTRRLRLLLGTGLLGGFTTYSLLALDTAELLLNGRAGLALLYAAATLVFGAVASWCGIAVGERVLRAWRNRGEGR